MREDDIRGILTTLTQTFSEEEKRQINLQEYLISLSFKDDTLHLVLEGQSKEMVFLQKLKEYYEQSLKNTYPQVKVMCVLTMKRPAPTSGPKASSKLQLPGVRHLIAVASGKGGVGKSSLTVNLALALTQLGMRVGILDADIYGPSLPKMLGLTDKPGVTADKKLIPLDKFGLKCMSIGLMISSDTPMIWRGPMVQGALQQMLKDVAWGDLDVLMIDMPPGTGDAQLTMAQQVKLSGAVIVSTPQDIALLDARKGINMFRQVAVPILGIVENMSLFHCPNCNHATPIFSHGGAQKTAHDMKIPFLGEIPLYLDIRLGADSGIPFNQENPDHEISQIYRQIAERMLETLPHVQQPEIHFEVE